MPTPTSGNGRHRRRIRIALPVAAAGIAAAVAAALLTSSAGAASAEPSPPAPAGAAAPSLAELEARMTKAAASDDVPGATADKSSYSSGSGIDAKIIGGSTTSITSAPWMAQLLYYDEANDFGFFCGGAVVAPTKILTAAHCVKGYDWSANGGVVTGTAQLYDGDLHGGTASAVHRQWTHPSYSSRTIDNDIAVLTLANPVKATPIRMTTSTATTPYAAGTQAKVYGWGRTTSTNQNVSTTLKTATLPIQSDATCAGYYGADFVKGHMVCAGTPATGTDAGTTTACNGDSGGPLVVNNRVVGVVSWGVRDCVAKGAYSVFSKVRTYVGTVYPRIDDTNLSGDHRADLWVRNASTKTGYGKDSKGTSFGARQSWGNWGAFNLVLQSDFNRDGYQDLIARRSSDGDVFWMHWVPASGSWATTKLRDGWKSRTRIVAPGDVTGDYLPDLLCVDSAGRLWIYKGTGTGSFSGRVQVGTGTGWNQYDFVVGHGDFNGDGKTDLIARNRSNGSVYLYKGKGSASSPFSPRVKVRTWSRTTYNKLAAVGDVTGDGKADLLARTPGGTLYLYKGTGKATSEIFATRISVGTGYQQYDIWA
ncbi:trypsin-like serine protease [Streptomyces sp. CC219B]|uniref:trypsin-like serine protease n=1 Tax=Streptomyces sp. CC219B TaxID=3044574 RepID=UPI0024A812D1|nr:trypsin-like serine protease [Streptomyces sp. CC219B]